MATFDAGIDASVAETGLAAGDKFPFADVSLVPIAWETTTADVLLSALLRLSAAGVVPLVVTPTTLAANTNNWAPGAGTVIRAAASAAYNLTGVVAGVQGECRILWNVGTFPITLIHELTSTAANRFTCAGAASIVLGIGDVALVTYSTDTSRWLASKLRSDISEGTLIVKQPGAATNKEIQILQDGTDGLVDCRYGILRLRSRDGGGGVVAVRISLETTDYVSFGTAGFAMRGTDGKVSWTTGVIGDSIDTSLVRLAANVAGPDSGDWFQNTAGFKRVAADVTNDSAVLAAITGLSVTVQAGRTYSFHACLNVTTAAVIEGVKVALAGTATITDLIADISVTSHAATPIVTMGRVTAFDAAIGQTMANAENGTVEIWGTITVNAGGTLRLDFAKNSDTGAANTTIRRGSWFRVEDVA